MASMVHDYNLTCDHMCQKVTSSPSVTKTVVRTERQRLNDVLEISNGATKANSPLQKVNHLIYADIYLQIK